MYRMREVSRPGPVGGIPGRAGRKRWVAPVIYGILGLELAAVIGFAATYNALDFRIYMWGGHAVTQDTRLYLALAYGHWFTYSPFAAMVLVPIAAVPLTLARVAGTWCRSRRWRTAWCSPSGWRATGRRGS